MDRGLHTSPGKYAVIPGSARGFNQDDDFTICIDFIPSTVEGINTLLYDISEGLAVYYGSSGIAVFKAGAGTYFLPEDWASKANSLVRLMIKYWGLDGLTVCSLDGIEFSSNISKPNFTFLISDVLLGKHGSYPTEYAATAIQCSIKIFDTHPTVVQAAAMQRNGNWIPLELYPNVIEHYPCQERGGNKLYSAINEYNPAAIPVHADLVGFTDAESPLIKNADFSVPGTHVPSTGWAPQTAWVIDTINHKAVCNGGSGNGSGYLYQDLSKPGKYTVSFIVSNVTAGDLTAFTDSGQSSNTLTADGTCTLNLTIINPDRFYIAGFNGFIGEIGPITVVRHDADPLITARKDINTRQPAAKNFTGINLLTNGDFSLGSSGWGQGFNGGWSFNNGTAWAPDGVNYGNTVLHNAYPLASIVGNESYRTTFKIISTSGTRTFFPAIGNGTEKAVGTSRALPGTYTEVLTPGTDVGEGYAMIFSTSGDRGAILDDFIVEAELKEAVNGISVPGGIMLLGSAVGIGQFIGDSNTAMMYQFYLSADEGDSLFLEYNALPYDFYGRGALNIRLSKTEFVAWVGGQSTALRVPTNFKVGMNTVIIQRPSERELEVLVNNAKRDIPIHSLVSAGVPYNKYAASDGIYATADFKFQDGDQMNINSFSGSSRAIKFGIKKGLISKREAHRLHAGGRFEDPESLDSWARFYHMGDGPDNYHRDLTGRSADVYYASGVKNEINSLR